MPGLFVNRWGCGAVDGFKAPPQAVFREGGSGQRCACGGQLRVLLGASPVGSQGGRSAWRGSRAARPQLILWGARLVALQGGLDSGTGPAWKVSHWMWASPRGDPLSTAAPAAQALREGRGSGALSICCCRGLGSESLRPGGDLKHPLEEVTGPHKPRQARSIERVGEFGAPWGVRAGGIQELPCVPDPARFSLVFPNPHSWPPGSEAAWCREGLPCVQVREEEQRGRRPESGRPG